MAVENYLEHSHLTEEYLQPFNQEGDNMADFNGSKPVMTVRDDEFKIILVDGASGDAATSKLSVVGEGDAFVADTNDFGVPMMGKDGSGNAIVIPVPLPITDNGGSLTVDASDLDIRNLTATDVVTAIMTDGTDTLAIAADGSIAVTDNGSSLTVDDGGSSLTVDAVDLDIRNLAFATDTVDVSGSAVTVTNTVDVNITNASIAVTATDLDIRDLTHASDSIKIGDGTDFLAVNTDGSINVLSSGESGDKICDYKTSATVGVGSEVLHHYVVTNAKTFWGKNVLVGARGAVKVRVGLSTDGIALSTPKFVYFQDPKENRQMEIDFLSLLGDGTKSIVIGITNYDASTSDVYSTLQGREV